MDLTNLSTLAGMKELLEKHAAAQAQLTQAKEARKSLNSGSTSTEISPKPKAETVKIKKKQVDSGEGGSASSASSHTSTPIMNEDGSLNVAAYIQNLQTQNNQIAQNHNRSSENVENPSQSPHLPNLTPNPQSQINPPALPTFQKSPPKLQPQPNFASNPLLSTLATSIRPRSATNSSVEIDANNQGSLTPNALFSSSKSGSEVLDVENEPDSNSTVKDEQTEREVTTADDLKIQADNENDIQQAQEFARIKANLDKSDDAVGDHTSSNLQSIPSLPENRTQNQAQALVAAIQKQNRLAMNKPVVSQSSQIPISQNNHIPQIQNNQIPQNPNFQQNPNLQQAILALNQIRAKNHQNIRPLGPAVPPPNVPGPSGVPTGLPTLQPNYGLPSLANLAGHMGHMPGLMGQQMNNPIRKRKRENGLSNIIGGKLSLESVLTKLIKNKKITKIIKN